MWKKANYERQLLALNEVAKSKSYRIKKALCKEPTSDEKLQRKLTSILDMYFTKKVDGTNQTADSQDVVEVEE